MHPKSRSHYGGMRHACRAHVERHKCRSTVAAENELARSRRHAPCMHRACRRERAHVIQWRCSHYGGMPLECRSTFLFLEHFPVNHRQSVAFSHQSLQVLMLLERQKSCVAKAI